MFKKQLFLVLQPELSCSKQTGFLEDGIHAHLVSWKAVIQNSSQLWYWKVCCNTDKGPSPPWLYFWVLCVMVTNITICHKVQSNTVIMPKGPVVLRSSGWVFALSMEKLHQILTYKLELLEPKSCMNQPVSIIFTMLQLRIRETITGGASSRLRECFKFQRNYLCFTELKINKIINRFLCWHKKP